MTTVDATPGPPGAVLVERKLDAIAGAVLVERELGAARSPVEFARAAVPVPMDQRRLARAVVPLGREDVE